MIDHQWCIMANLSPEPDASSTGIDSLSIAELIVCPLDDNARDKPSARTVALTTEDILREIFWCFDTTDSLAHTVGNSATLLHAALTCKAFMEPALDALWWSMSSMMPALKLLPNLRTVPDTSNIFTFSGGLSASAWARFDYHAKRVREFHHHSAPDEEMAVTALFHFSRYRPAIFPRLQKIVWTASLSPSVMLLTSPTLKSLDITAAKNNDPSVMTTLLEPIHNCPLLESILIHGFSRVLTSDQDLVDIGSGLPSARVLAIPFSPPPAIDPAGDTDTAHPQSAPTLLGLRLLAELCPGLTSLQLSIDTREMPTLTGEPLIHGLQTLFVGDSPVGDAFLVAKHLDCLFPYLNKISGSNSITIPTTTYNQWGHVGTTMVTTDTVRDGWELVEKIVHSCQAARADEHKRTGMRCGRVNSAQTRAARVLVNHS